MPWHLDRTDLPAYVAGVGLLSSGGGGRAGGFALTRAHGCDYPMVVHEVEDLDPSTPCVAVGFGGSTALQSERLPGSAPFAAAFAAVGRWTGTAPGAVCPAEIAGASGLSVLGAAPDLDLVDADLMGRGFARIDQFTLFADRLPGLVLAVETGDGGVLLHADPRPADAERILRSAFHAAGGWAGLVVGGFTVGDLRGHAVIGSMRRALVLGEAWTARRGAPLARRAEAVGGRLLGSGRVTVSSRADDARTRSFALTRDDGSILRVLHRDDFLSAAVDGSPVANTPDIIDVLNSITGEALQVDEVADGHHLAVLTLPAPDFWTAKPHRAASVDLAAHGLGDLVPVTRHTDRKAR